MRGTLEIKGKRKNGDPFVVYYSVAIYSGIAADYYEKYESAGCTVFSIRVI